MKICITAKGNDINSPAEDRFGRAPVFLIVDDESGAVTPIVNDNAGGAGGVGVRSAQIMVEQGVSVVITGQVGGNANSALKGAGIEVYTFRGGTANEALAAFKAGTLTRIL
ncbi:NifB/NifX family molybdenum-iron cluster-binding protein [Methanofollis fontis]|uniref:Dinitrogenase iron-molybdenum cofactor biosynthesis protein n=1 Tax=Methanofollis fontis TaxID=2052832 RepID=A0A483CXD5_9EURY|nr:NifB/NifX family molybdenum-iron cluster-binding protein [Methanofollis fontis]TAJ43903.1 dinitrogenase iron-molybdenum cofactor biosynthesis protein [Methanofollis fontis]